MFLWIQVKSMDSIVSLDFLNHVSIDTRCTCGQYCILRLSQSCFHAYKIHLWTVLYSYALLIMFPWKKIKFVDSVASLDSLKNLWTVLYRKTLAIMFPWIQDKFVDSIVSIYSLNQASMDTKKKCQVVDSIVSIDSVNHVSMDTR